MKIEARIENLRYEATICNQLKTVSAEEFASGIAFQNSAFLLSVGGNTLAISQWVSPKRTRTYPYARVYDTMTSHRRVTIIPFLKDEGKDGDRDFLQWDTISLMSLLGVYVILAYYHKAQKNPDYQNKITDHEFDYEYLRSRIDELSNYKLDALHWNLNELNTNLLRVAELSKFHYKRISKMTGVEMHADRGVDKRIEVVRESAAKFQSNSRELAASAQNREYQTNQPKERTIEHKATITIKNYLGGYYYFTVDEVYAHDDFFFLIEKKHSKDSSLPNIGDIKDGLVKMMLFSNLSEVNISGKEVAYYPTLGLTSIFVRGYCHTFSTDEELASFFSTNDFSPRRLGFVTRLLDEGRKNNVLIFLMNSEKPQLQKLIVQEFLERRR